MTAKEYIKIVQDKRDMIKEIMIEGMKECDKGCWNGWYELYLDFSAEDLAPDWEYWPDSNSSRYTGDSDVMGVLKIGPRGSWSDWFDDIEDAACMVGLLAEDLIRAARPWLGSEEFIGSKDSDDCIEWDHIETWLTMNPDEPIVKKLLAARADSIDREYEDVYSDWADREIEDLMRSLDQMARDEADQEAYRAAWARGEVW